MKKFKELKKIIGNQECNINHNESILYDYELAIVNSQDSWGKIPVLALPLPVGRNPAGSWHCGLPRL